MSAFFHAAATTGSPKPKATPFSAEHAGNWQATIVSIDLGPGKPPVDVSAMPPFAFSLAISGDGYRLTSADGDRQVELAATEQGLASREPPRTGGAMRLRTDGEGIIGEIDAGETSAGRIVFRANRIR